MLDFVVAGAFVFHKHIRFITFREQGRDLNHYFVKSPTHRQIQKATWQLKNATKYFDYITITDRLNAVNWGNDSHPTSVVKPINGIQTFPVTAKAI